MLRLNPFIFLVVFATLCLCLCRSAPATIFPSDIHARLVEFSPNGKLVAALGIPSQMDASRRSIDNHLGARVWTVADGKIHRNYSWAEAEGGLMAFSEDSQFLALQEQSRIKLVHLPTNQIRYTLETRIHRGKTFFSPDGRWLIVQSLWLAKDHVGPGHRDFEVWRLHGTDNGPTAIRTRLESREFEILYSPTGPRIVSSTSSKVPQWCHPASEQYLWSKAVSSDGKWQAFANKPPLNTVQVWDATSCTLKNTFPVPAPKVWDTEGTQVIFLPANRWLLNTRQEGLALYLWDITEADEVKIQLDLGDVNTSGVILSSGELSRAQFEYAAKFAISRDESRMAVTRGRSYFSKDNSVLCLYEMTTGERIMSLY